MSHIQRVVGEAPSAAAVHRHRVSHDLEALANALGVDDLPAVATSVGPAVWVGHAVDVVATEWLRGFARRRTDSAIRGHAQRLVWRGAIPQAWQSGCPPATTQACTNTRAYSNNQIADSDFVFNSSQSMGTSNTNCNLFGPFSVDVESVALHEFGHWGRLTHTTDGQAVMFQSYVTCRRLLHAHDDESMTEQYRGR
ncbi:MAG: matrixin family metalloprotease [Actinomycetes bacterium]